MNQPDPMLSMLQWLCEQMMEYPAGNDLSDGPKVRQGGYIPFFVNAYKHNEAALTAVVQEAYVNGVSTRKTGQLAKQPGVNGISRSQVSKIKFRKFN